jgi:glycine hydroxymethyltransferase
MAEGLFHRILGNRKDIEVASAGVHAVRGQPPSLHAIHVCEQEGVDIRGVRSQPLTATLVDRATHIFAMTGAHLETIHSFFPQAADKTYLLREFEEPGMTVWRDVPDPIGCSRDVYTACAATIKNALPTVLAFVEQSELAVPAKSRGGGTSALPWQTSLTIPGPLRILPPPRAQPAVADCAKSIRKFSMWSWRRKNGSGRTSN